LKNGGVIDLKLSENRAQAQVVADRLYQVQIRFEGVEEEQLNALRNACAGKLTSLIDLIRGDLSDDVMELICDPAFGLFPRYSELKPSCDCLDDAVLCRHAAAALYAIAPRLDDQPELFFTLRGIDPESFFALDAVAGPEEAGDLSAEDLSATFGIEIDL
ncbi:MAG: SWIM zinc finger family protein, partial [Lentisphaeria bacterium]|nr:SWIM zinc finger family protein [Lentisphaeria bacterium]